MIAPPALVRIPLRRSIAQAFGLKAARYERHAVVQSAILERLVTLTANYQGNPARWVDLGCGSGMFERMARKQGISYTTMIGLDIAFDALIASLAHRDTGTLPVCGDLTTPPFKPGSFDGVVLASVLQWTEHPEQGIRRAAELLRNGGICAFSVFVEGSFRELFETRRALGLPVAIQCPSHRILESLFSTPPFRLLHGERFHRTMFFPDARTLLLNLSATGACATGEKRLLRSEQERFCATYESKFRGSQGVPLTWEAFIGLAVKEPAA